MQLSSDQITAARACGVVFPPASPAQVQRLSMQRRVFHIDGQPHLATRDGSFFETAATLEHLIAEQLEAQQLVDLAVWEASGATAPPEIEAAPVQDAPQPAAPLRPRTEVPAAAPETPALPAVPTMVEAPTPVPAEAAATIARRMPKDRGVPRWVTAGAVRRGRLAEHWALRGRGRR